MVIVLGACSHTVPVSNITVSTPIGLSKISGRYAAQVQTGGWVLSAKSKNGGLTFRDYSINLNGSYLNAMQEGLKVSLENVEFVSEVMTPAQLKEKGFDAQIVVYQGSADAAYSVLPGLWTMTLGEISLATTLAIIVPEAGLKYQQSLDEKGEGNMESIMGSQVEEALAKATGNAIDKIVKSTLLYVRDGIHSTKSNSKPA
ncbi:MAG: hypothetical protein J0G29_02020 [Alphaproteobacteria bacterium]|nr:hypothetical protein [Alphaproteobacteria bacterium]